MTPEQRITILENRLNALEKSDRLIFEKKLQVLDGRNIMLGTSNGTKVGTAATQKVGFFGTTPVVQQSILSTPIVTLTDCSNVVISLRTALLNLGLGA